jgi:hypothetical protein
MSTGTRWISVVLYPSDVSGKCSGNLHFWNTLIFLWTSTRTPLSVNSFTSDFHWFSTDVQLVYSGGPLT